MMTRQSRIKFWSRALAGLAALGLVGLGAGRPRAQLPPEPLITQSQADAGRDASPERGDARQRTSAAYQATPIFLRP